MNLDQVREVQKTICDMVQESSIQNVKNITGNFSIVVPQVVLQYQYMGDISEIHLFPDIFAIYSSFCIG